MASGMTNDMIIWLKRCELMKDGIIGGSGEYAEVEINGEVQTMEIPEEIHTYQMWKSMGFQVRKGEKAIAQFTIWKYTNKEVEKSNGEIVKSGRCFMKKSSFFKPSQVEKIA